MILLVTHITIGHDFTSSSVGLILDYWKLRRAASVEKCGLNSNACVVVVAALTSPEYRSRMLSIVCLFYYFVGV